MLLDMSDKESKMPSSFCLHGARGAAVPHDVVGVVQVNPSVTSISACAFQGHNKLTKVELSEGFVEIWGTIIQVLRPFYEEFQHPQFTQKDLR